MMKEIFLRLDQKLLERGVDAGVLIQEAGRELFEKAEKKAGLAAAESELPTVRKIIDNQLGFLSLVQIGRHGPVKRDVVRLDTDIPLDQLPLIPGVVKKSTDLLTLYS